MKYIKYVDLPRIPKHLIEPLKNIINKPSRDFNYVSAEYKYFKLKPVNNDLKSWLQPLFEFEIFPQYQLVYDGIPIHVDADRIFAYSYLLDTGGDNVETAIYDENHKLLQSEILELKRWHYINTSMLHGVHGINPLKVRIAISVTVCVPRR